MTEVELLSFVKDDNPFSALFDISNSKMNLLLVTLQRLNPTPNL